MLIDKDAFSHGPINSKIWLCDMVKRLQFSPVDRVFVLGSWSGTMPFLMFATGCVTTTRYVLVDTNEEYQQQARAICNVIDCHGMLEIVVQDANTINYPAGSNFVVCTSTDNIETDQWFKRIPAGTIVALQGRTGGHRDCVQPYASMEEFNTAYPMHITRFSSRRDFVYPDHNYTRFMKIGIK